VLTAVFNVQFKMKYLASYLLLALAGNESPSASDIKEVLSSVGIDAEDARLEKLLSELEGKSIQEVRLTAPNIWNCTNKSD
jgi:ribosomal protein L12E/L44/L45/RPP1/RPP2